MLEGLGSNIKKIVNNSVKQTEFKEIKKIFEKIKGDFEKIKKDLEKNRN